MHENIRAVSYPVIERNGIVFAYMGPGDPPPFPALDCFAAPDSHVFAFKGLWECNWLQAMEVGIDPAHATLSPALVDAIFGSAMGDAVAIAAHVKDSFYVDEAFRAESERRIWD